MGSAARQEASEHARRGLRRLEMSSSLGQTVRDVSQSILDLKVTYQSACKVYTNSAAMFS